MSVRQWLCAMACAGVVLSPRITLAQPEGPQLKVFSAKLTERLTDSLIRRTIELAEAHSPIPFGQTYDQLSEEHRAFLRSRYEGMNDSDEPPYPERGIQPIVDALMQAQVKLSTIGALLLVVDVDGAGVATDVTAHSAVDPEMTRAAASVLLLTRYKPGRWRGEPRAMQYLFNVQFRMK